MFAPASSRSSRSVCRCGILFFIALLAPRPGPAEDAALLVSPRELSAGASSAFTVTTFDSEKREPLARSLQVTLRDGDTVVAVLHEGQTPASGHLHVPFEVPDVSSGSYTLDARIQGIQEPLKIETTVSRTPAILIETDKPIYKPSQTIQGRVLLIDNALRPVSGEIELSFQDAKGIRIDRRTLSAGEFGVAPFTLDLASEVNFGVWKIRARSEGLETVRDVKVEEYTLPRFELSLDFERSWALVDEEVRGAATARYFFGKDVQGDAVIVASRWVGVWEEYARVEGALSGGKLDFTLPAVDFVAGTPTSSGQGTVRVEVEVVDSTGHAQSATEILGIAEAPVVLGLIPRVGTLKPGLPLGVVVTARSPEGIPLEASVLTSVTFYGGFGETLGRLEDEVQVTDGSGLLELTPPANTSYATIVARAERDGRWTEVETRVGSAYSTSASFLSVSRAGADSPAEVGETVSFSVLSTHSGSVFYEVYAGGRTVLSDATESDTFSIVVSAEMIPKAKVVAYKINPDNEVVADSLSLEVKPSSQIAIQAVFDPTDVKPGDPIELSIDAGTGQRTLIGLSIVDASVLALGRGRLALGEVFAELERRFLEPKVEVHEADGGFEADMAIGGPFFGPPRNYGALDTLREVGLDVASSANISVPEGGILDWARMDDAEGPPAAGAGAEGETAPADAVRVREYFPETWVWEPLLLSDDTGKATLSLTVPDSITRWQLGAVGSSPAGMSFGETELTVFQDFFVEPSLPVSVTRGEEFAIKVDLFNYLDTEQEVSLDLGDAGWFTLLSESGQTVHLAPDTATPVFFSIRPTEIGDHPVELTAVGSQYSDAVRRVLRVVPEGIPAESVLNNVVEAGQTVELDLSIPTNAVEGSARAYLHITPSPVGQTLNGVSDLLAMPYGCGEQNMIFLAPDIEVLKYLREIGELAPEIRAEAEYLVNVGYQRELTYQTTDGGFAAFGGENGSLWLTSFVLSTFSGAREVRDIDEGVLADAAAMLVSRRRVDGSFETDDFLIHKEMDGGLENIYAMTAYVTNALADYTAGGFGSAGVLETLQSAAGYLSTMWTEVRDDAYSLSIGAVALGKIPSRETSAGAVLDRLLELGTQDGVGIHWEPYSVETTGYAAMALLDADGGVGRPEAAAAVDWLSTQRNALGGYGGSTQDTVVALRALFHAARKVRRDLVLDLTVNRGDETLWTLHLDESNFDILSSVELPLQGGPALELAAAGSGSTGYQVARKYNLPGTELPPSRDMLIDVSYDTEDIEVDDILDVTVSLVYTGMKEATGMAIADVGVPTGFAVVASSLKDLVDSKRVSRFELAGRKVILYIDALYRDEPLELGFQMRALYPVRAEAPLSHAYEYYDREVEAHHRLAASITVSGRSGDGPFRRGDVNVDDFRDISDVYSVLFFLFLGGEPLPCRDAADVNDDGRLNITDPVYLVRHLFLGTEAPPGPYPDCGLDPSADDLTCESFSLCE